MKLDDLMVDSKSAWVEYPDCPGFEVEVANLSRKELLKLKKECTTHKMGRSTRQMEEILDEQKFVKAFTKAIIKNWKGLTLGYLETLILIDVGDNPLDTELPFDLENAERLVENSAEFDQWINEVAFDLDTFRTRAD